MQPKRPYQLALYYALPFVLITTALFLFLLFWERRNLAEEQREGLTHTATALLQQIIVTRSWNAEHGGVYARIDDRTQPNPYLSDRDRDIQSLSGTRYTKINPAYMTRQIAELSKSSHGYRFNITSLRPLNPANRPDAWEEAALRNFERGASYQQSMVRGSDPPVFRYMVPLITEESCLACHGKQHYKAGDVRGGISVTVPLEESERIYHGRARAYLVTGAGLWLSMILFIFLVSYTLSRKVVADMAREIELSRLKTAIELAGAAAHEIRQPLTVLITMSDLLKMKLAQDPETLKDLDAMIMQCRRIDAMIARMQNITEYRTKTYVDDIKIADLGGDRPKQEP